MPIQLEHSNFTFNSSQKEELKATIIPVEEKEFLDLICDILVTDIIKSVKNEENGSGICED